MVYWAKGKLIYFCEFLMRLDDATPEIRFTNDLFPVQALQKNKLTWTGRRPKMTIHGSRWWVQTNLQVILFRH